MDFCNKNLREEMYKVAMALKRSGLGKRRIHRELTKRNYEIPMWTLSHWLYSGTFPRKRILDLGDRKLTPEKAFILGVIGPGDGYISRNCIGLTVVDRDFAEKFRRSVESTYGVRCKCIPTPPHGFGKKEQYRVNLYSKCALGDVNKYAVSYKESTWSIPREILSGSPDLQSAYVQGFADSQGSVGNRQIIIASSNPNGLNEIKLLFTKLGIRTSIIKKKDTFVILINGRRDLIKFNDLVGFSIQRKEQKLKEVLNRYKRFKTLTSLVDESVPKMEELRSKGMSLRGIARELGLGHTTVIRRMRGEQNRVL